MDDVLNDALSNLVYDNYERGHKGYKNRQADVALIRAALAAQPAASAEPLLFAINSVLKSFKESEKAGYHTRDREFAISTLEFGLEKYRSAPVAASAEPSDEEVYALAEKHFPRDAFRMQVSLNSFARALLSRYGRPAGDAQPVAQAHLYMRDGRRQFVLCELGTTAAASLPLGKHDLYAAPVAANLPRS